MDTRIFGRTGVKVSVLTMGGCGLGYVEQNEVDEAVKLALDYGINMIDVAPTYGNAEVRLNPWIKKYRNKFFLAAKTLKRNKKSAFQQLNRSLQRLGTSYFDLYQFHAVSSTEELDQILGKNGAMEAFKEAKETGLIKYIGITVHNDLRLLQKALQLSDEFDTVLLPVYIGALVNPEPENDFRSILTITQEQDIGVTAIKAIVKSRWKGDPIYKTWYEPLDDQTLVDQTVWFTLSQEGVTTYSLPCDVRLWAMVLDAGSRYQKLNDEEQRKVLKLARENQFQPLFPE